MSRRLRPALACAALVAACMATAAPAQAITTDITNWSLNEAWKYYGGGSGVQFNTSVDGDGTVDFRWADSSMTKTTIIAAVTCGDYTELGRKTFQGGDTSFKQIFDGFNGQCFVLRGKTESGTTTPHDGRLRR